MQAFVLAAGKGTRLGEISKTTPKCLNDIGGFTILEYILYQLKSLDVSKVVINVHHLGQQIIDFVKTKDFGLEIVFSVEKDLLGVFGGLQQASKFLSEDFLMINSDIYTEFDLRELVNNKFLITLLTNNELSSPILVNQNLLVGIESKTGFSVIPKEFSNKVGFTGIQYIQKDFIELIKDFDSNLFLFEVYFKLISMGYLINTVNLGESNWIDIGTPNELERIRGIAKSISF